MALFGTILLADFVSEAAENKFVIAGTYNTLKLAFQGERPAERHRRGLHLYVRFNPERVGAHKVMVAIKDQNRQVYDESLVRLMIDCTVQTPNAAMEIAIQPPDIVFAPEAAYRVDDSCWRFDSTIELHVDGELIGSTPLWVLYVRKP